jgi:hypothetical protein
MEVFMAVRSGGQAPYAPPQTLLGLVQRYRRNLPTPFTRDVLTQAGVPESLVPRTLQALRLLDLIDETGNPTAELEGLKRAGTAEFPKRLEAVVRAAYADIFQYLDPATATVGEIEDLFRHYEPLGQLQRIVALFMGLCEASGIIPEGTRKQTPPATRKTPTKKPVVQKRSSDSAKGFETATAVEGVDPLLAVTLQKLPPHGVGWTAAERTKWLDFFTTTLDFVVPTHPVPKTQPTTAEE